MSQNKHRALIIGKRGLDRELREVLGGYGYFVEYCRTRLEAFRLFRAHRQSLVIVHVDSLTGHPERTFRFFRLVHEKAIVLVACDRKSEILAACYLVWGANDVLRFPLQRESLNQVLLRTSTYHRELVRDTFRCYLLYFGFAMLPLWAVLIYFAAR